jgi:predicted Zn-dependent protease
MQRAILRDLLVLLGVFGLIWLGASLFRYPKEPELMSVRKEEKLGHTYTEGILKNPMFRELENEGIDSAVEVIGDRLRDHLDDSPYQYRFIVFQNEMINAFTLPGGNILVSTGLLRFCDTPEELASVLAHEMGHVEERHVVARLVKEMGIEILTSGDTYVLGEVTGMLTSTHFDRKQEEEADRFAALLLERSSIEPRTLATLFRRLEEESGNDLLEHFEIVSTHPSFRSRIREALSYEPAADFKAVPVDVDWEKVKAELGQEAPGKE